MPLLRNNLLTVLHLLAFHREGQHIGLWRNVIALNIHCVEFLEDTRHRIHSTSIETVRIQFFRRQQCGMKPDATGHGMPATGIFERRNDVLNGAAIEHIAPMGLGSLGSRYHITPGAVSITLLRHDTALLKPHVAIATDKIHRAVNFRVLEIMLAQVVIRIISILIG